MRILIITQKVDKNDPVLGFFHHWIEKFSEKFEKITVICLWQGRYDLPSNVQILSLGKEKGSPKISQLFNFYKYIWMKRKNYDVVFVHMNPVWICLGFPVWKFLYKRTFLWYAHKSVTLKLKIAEKLVDLIFTPSRESFRLRSQKVNIVGHGIDTNVFKPKFKEKDEDFIVVTVGRIAPIKNLETLIKAAHKGKEETPFLKFYIYGLAQTGPEKEYREKLDGLIKDLRVQEHVIFQGPVDNHALPNVLGEADLFWQASETNSLDKAVLEAMSMNIPVITSNRSFLNIPGVKVVGLSINEFTAALLKTDWIQNTREYIEEKHSLELLISNLKYLMTK